MNILQMQTCCFTGHRELSFFARMRLRRRLPRVIAELMEQGVRYFGCGGAQGFDTLAAQAVLAARRRHPQIRLILVLACPEQADRWPAPARKRFQAILAQADKVVYVQPTYTASCFFKRNRHLANHSQVCVCYCRRDTGGTAMTVRYAKEKGLRIIAL